MVDASLRSGGRMFGAMHWKGMKKRTPFVIGFVALPYWALLLAFIFRDFYLSWPRAGLLMKALLPVAVIANLAGISLRIRGWRARKGRMTGAVVLNAPLIVAAWVVWWLFFGVKI